MEVFDEPFRQALERRFASRPSWQRPELAFVALSDERADLRRWIDFEVTALAQPGRDKLVSRLRDDASFVAAYNELAVAAVFRDAGVDVTYEADLQGVTPDFFAPATVLRRALVIEVWTREMPREVRGQRRAWSELAGRIAQIPVPVGLVVRAVDGSAPKPPASGDAKRIASRLQDWLLSWRRMPGAHCDIGAYRFTVLIDLPGAGLRARLAPPTPGGWVDSDTVIRNVEKKVRRYRNAVQRLDASLLVVTASDPVAALNVTLLLDALAGRQSFSLSFSPVASGELGSWPTRMVAEHVPVEFDPALSAVGYIDVRLGDPILTLIANPVAARPVPALDSPRVRG